MKPEDVIPTYDREGPAWAATRDRRLIERPWLDRALMLAPHGRGRRRVLDLGCGAGRPIAEYLIDRGCMVTGVDASRPMIELFARVVPRAVALHADMRTLRLSDTFDLILAWDSLFHLPPEDQRAMFGIFSSHAAPGGVLLFTAGPEVGERIGVIGGSSLYHASLDPTDYRALLDDWSFEELGYWPEEPACGNRTIWMARRR
ncbi:class I SAM-dependent methyltransferase [Rubellimicrobium aerolatum]|uniref:Class I SAM-dependent methyltransferase n=1 Tax=Rubellimicrobium aerolatum TaxID=490979 RepID=A0ABW0SBT8_9RHOB|nr:class I SAM-dependent methyltransferase [Rubellimicrobium aerolatum]MBP1805961.1 SAM-dependent methyltransferase [Rubellimicrobium aerolatum]